MMKLSVKRIVLSGICLLASIVLIAGVFITIRLINITVYPDAKARVTSQSPGKEYNVQRSRNNLSGMNFGLALAAPREGDWGVVFQESDFEDAQKAGFSYIRVQVRFFSHLTADENGYRLNKKIMSRLDWVINQILKRNMTAIITLYNLVPDEKLHFESNLERKNNEEKFLAVWDILSKRYKDYSHKLYFELANEPHRPITANLWNEYARKAIAKIRASGGNNTDRMIIVGVHIGIGWIIHNWDQINGIDDLVLPSAEVDPNIMVTFHYYNPYSFTYQGQTYTRDLAMSSLIWKGNTWVNSDKQKAYVKGDFDKIQRWAQTNQRQIILGEFGVSIYADLGSQARWTRLVRQEAESRQMIWLFWDFYSQDKLGSLYNQSTRAWRQPILDALLQ